MSDSEAETDTTTELVFEYELDAPPEKVWRALSIPAFRDKWLPQEALVSAEPVSSVPGQEVRFGMREDEPPFVESVVMFQVLPSVDGGTKLRIVHELADAQAARQGADTADWPTLMRAA